MEAFDALWLILAFLLIASPLSNGVKMAIVFGIVAILILLIILRIKKKRFEKQQLINEEQRKALENLHRMKQELKTGAKETITYELGSSDQVHCPYCGSLFKVDDSKCPHCGAAINKVEGKLTITKVSEGGDILMALDNQHKERMAQIKAEKQIKLRAKYAEVGTWILLFFGIIIVFLAIK